MNRLQKAAVLAKLVDRLHEAGSWCGETHIQKTAFFLQELLGVPLEYDFILYKHGPFSFDLRDELTSLRADEILQLEPQSPPYGPKFVVTQTGRVLQSRHPRTLGQFVAEVEFVAEHLGPEDVVNLERLATALYVTSRIGVGSSEERARRLVQLKPHIPIEEARAAMARVDSMRESVSRG